MLRFQCMQDVSINTGLGSLYANKSALCTRVLILILSPSGDSSSLSAAPQQRAPTALSLTQQIP